MQRAKKKMRFNLFPPQVCLLFSLLLTSCRERFLRGNTVNQPLLQFRCTKNTLIVCPCFAGLGELLRNLLNHIMDSLRSCYSFYSRKFFFIFCFAVGFCFFVFFFFAVVVVVLVYVGYFVINQRKG